MSINEALLPKCVGTKLRVASAGVCRAPSAYRRDNATGTARGDEAETLYFVVNGSHYNSHCCFDVSCRSCVGPHRSGESDAFSIHLTCVAWCVSMATPRRMIEMTGRELWKPCICTVAAAASRTSLESCLGSPNMLATCVSFLVGRRMAAKTMVVLGAALGCAAALSSAFAGHPQIV